MGVASVNNEYVMSDYIQLADGTAVFYQPTMELLYGYTDIGLQEWYADQTLEYVVVDGLGSEEDFAQVDVSGKVAIIKRGTLNFGTKVNNAAAAGAVAAVIWNNTDEDIFTFGMTTSSTDVTSGEYSSIPAILVSQSDGQKMADAADKHFDVPTGAKPRIDSTGGQMSSFTSWGVSADLRLLPDLAGIGGNVYSCYDGGEYGLMSGTSMATPQVCGVTALVKEYLKEQGITEGIGDMVEALMMSTANPVVSDESNVEASPRQQGAGLVDALKAVTSGAYLTVDDGRPKAELGDGKDGTYSFRFEVNNFSDAEKTYSLSASLLTEDFVTEDGEEFMAGYDRKLEGTVTFSESKVTVAAGESAKVDVTITLSETDKAWFTEHYKNGGYVEGYVYLTNSAEGGVGMSLPFLGFYGSWSQVPVFDAGYWYDNSYWAYNGAEGIEEAAITAEEYWHVPWVSMGVSTNDWLLGLNPYAGVRVENGKVRYNEENNVISPNGDGYMDQISDLYLSLLRNARYLWLTYTDAETGKVLGEPLMLGYENKTMYNSSYGSTIPFAYSLYYTNPLYNFADCEDGDKVNLTISAVVDYDLDEKVNVNPVTGEATLKDGVSPDSSITIPISIDTTAPKLKDVKESTRGGKRYLTVTIEEEHPATVALMNPTGTQVYDQVFDDELTKNEDGTYTAMLDITGHGDSFRITLGDYGYNQSQNQVKRTAEGDNSPEVDGSALYAYQVYDLGLYYYYGWDYMFGWTTVDTDPASETTVNMLTSDAYEYYAINAAEYVDGYVFAVDAGGNFLYMEPGLWNRTTICNLGCNVIDMAFDDENGIMYVIISDENDDPDNFYAEDTYAIATLNLLTGELDILNNWAADGNSYYGKRQMPWAMTFVDGTLYCCRYETPGLFKLNLENFSTTPVQDKEGNDVVPTLSNGYELKPGYAQSMTYSKQDGKLYWLYCDSSVSSTLVTVDPTDWSYTLKDLGYSEYVGALTLEETDYELPESGEVTGLVLSETEVTLGVGATKQLETYLLPWNAPATEITWAIAYQEPLDFYSDDDVITIDETTGLIEAVSAGTASVIAFCGDDEDSYVEASCDVTVMDVSGSFRAFNFSGDGNYGTWQDIDLSTMHGTDVLADNGVYFAAADYNGHDGYIYGYDANDYMAYKVSAETGEATQLKGSSSSVCDMAYDYSRGMMFAITFDDMVLYAMNMRNGELVAIAEIQTEAPLRTLACDMSGYLYTIDCAGQLLMIELTDEEDGGGGGGGGNPVFPPVDGYDDGGFDPGFGVDTDETTGSMTAIPTPIMEVPYNADSDYGQSMCYDHNNVYGEVLYWCNTNLDTFYQIDLTAGIAYDLGTVDSHQYPQYMGMHVVPEDEDMIPPLESVSAEKISVEPMFLLAGDSAELEIDIEPLNANEDIVLYYAIDEYFGQNPDDIEADDQTVAVVDSKTGVVTAVQPGKAYVDAIAFAPDTDLSGIEDIYEFAYGEGEEAVVAWESAEVTVKNPTTSRIRAYDYISDVWLGVDQYAPAESSTYGNVRYNGSTFELTAAEYVGTEGLIYGYASDAAFFEPVEYFTVFDGSTLSVKSMTALGSDFPIVYDMAYDYNSGVMYALAGTSSVVSLYYVDLATGALIEIAGMNQLGHTFLNIAVDADGTIYAMTNGTAELYTIERTKDGVSVSKYPIAWTEVSNPYKSSMSYDYDTGYLYWTPYESLYLIDLNDSSVSLMGSLPGENYALMLMAKDKTRYPEASGELTAVAMATDFVELNRGDSTTLNYLYWPSDVEVESAVWSSSDENVATVDENGVVTGIASGTATITVTLNGTVTATCTVVVYGSNDTFPTYNITDRGFSAIDRTDPGKVVNLTANEEEAPVSAMVMIDNVIYAYDEDGNLFTTSAADNFRRTYIGHHGVDVSEYDDEAGDAAQKYVATTTLVIRDMTVLEDDTVLALGAITWNVHTEYYLGNGETRESDWVGEPALIGGSSRLYQVDTETGKLKELCILKDGTAEMSGGNMLQAAGNSVYVYNTVNDRIAQVDLENGNTSPIVTLQSISVRGEAYQTMGMTYDGNANCLYMLVNINKNYNRLVKYDIDSGLLRDLGIVDGNASEADLFHGLVIRTGVKGEHEHTCIRVDYKAPTCSEDGYERFQCTQCDYSYENTLPATGKHEYVDQDGKMVCMHCGKEMTIVTPPVTPVVPTTPSTSGQGKLPFMDVTANDWFFSSVTYVYENGLMNGVGDGTRFDPTGSVTRAMVVQTLYRLSGSPAVSGTNDFTDLTQDWYRDAVQWAYKNGITTGRSETTFAPDECVTREELATFFSRYAEFRGCDVSARANLGVYSDLSAVSSWAKTAMSWANAEGLILGRTETTLVPEGTAARSELATILMRFCQTIV